MSQAGTRRWILGTPRAVALLLVALSLSTTPACTGGGALNPPTPDGFDLGLGDGPFGDGAPDLAKSDATSSDLALGPVTFIIEFDYRFDTQGYFSIPARKAALEGAARVWGRLIKDDFQTIPANTPLKTRDPENPNVAAVSVTRSTDIADLVIFVGASSIDGAGGTLAKSFPTLGISEVPDPTLQQQLGNRAYGADYEPWTGWISFDADDTFYYDPDPDQPKSIPSTLQDFMTVATHEIGHLLGFGTADAFAAKVSSGSFTGSNAVGTYGAQVPLTNDLAHVPITLTFNGSRILMDASDTPGVRQSPSLLDQAMLKDIGYHF